MTLRILAPFAGRVLALTEVPDPVFAQGMVGAGLAILPAEDVEHLEVLAPADGTVLKAMAHAIALITEDGAGILVHVGLDTVGLKGRGFEVLVGRKQLVRAGQPVLRVDAAAVRDAGPSLCSPVVAMDTAPEGIITTARHGTTIAAGDPLFELLPIG